MRCIVVAMLLLFCRCKSLSQGRAKMHSLCPAPSPPHRSHNIVSAVSSLARQQIKAAVAASRCIVPVAEACRKDDQRRLLLLLLMLLREFPLVVVLLRQFNINLRGRIEQGTRRPPPVSVFLLGHGGHDGAAAAALPSVPPPLQPRRP